MRVRSALFATLTALVAAVPAAAHAQDASVYVVHGVSGGGLGLASFGFPVDVWVEGVGCAITGLNFTGIVGPIALGAGTYEVRIFPATPNAGTCKGSAAITANVELKGDRSYSIVAHQSEDGAPTASVFRNEALEAASRGDGSASVAVRHTAAAPMVDALVKKGKSVTALGPFGNGEQLGSVDLPNGTYDLGVGLPGAGEPVFGYFSQRFRKNASYYVYAFGSVGNGTLAFAVHEIR